MTCTDPYITRGGAFGCGKCVPCRMKHRRVWAHRIQLEALCHEANSFVTLTYEDAPRSLDPVQLRLWLKRLRKRLAPQRFRFYAVGEYGDQSGRPHYHAALFNFGSCQSLTPLPGVPCPCSQCSAVRETWGFGHVLVGSLTPQSAAYLAGYVTKKSLRTVSLSSDQHPEFARMSLRPGIGANAMWEVADALLAHNLKTVPQGLRHGQFIAPLGRYLRKKLSEYADAPLDKSFVDEKLQLVRAYAFDRSLSVQDVWREVATPAALQLEHKLSEQQRLKRSL